MTYYKVRYKNTIGGFKTIRILTGGEYNKLNADKCIKVLESTQLYNVEYYYILFKKRGKRFRKKTGGYIPAVSVNKITDNDNLEVVGLNGTHTLEDIRSIEKGFNDKYAGGESMFIKFLRPCDYIVENAEKQKA